MATKKAAKKSAVKKYPTKSGKKSATPPSKRWSAKVTTDSTKPGPGLFKKSAKAIAEGLARRGCRVARWVVGCPNTRGRDRESCR